MSIWTRVNGCMRAYIPKKNRIAISPQELEYWLGRIPTIPEDTDTVLPCGTEGVLEYRYQMFDGGMVSELYVHFFGDLRDLDDDKTGEIYRYFKDMVSRGIGMGCMFKSMVVEITQTNIPGNRILHWGYRSPELQFGLLNELMLG